MAGCSTKVKAVLQHLSSVRCSKRVPNKKSFSSDARNTKSNIFAHQKVLASNGKWVRIEGHGRPLIDFTSNDIFGIQNHEVKAEDTIRPMPKRNQHIPKRLSTKQRLHDKLATVHGKDDAAMTSLSYDVALRTWLRGMFSKNAKIYAPSDGKNIDTTKGDSLSKLLNTYNDLQALESELQKTRDKCPTALRLVLVEMKAKTSSVEYLRRVCYLSEKQYASVILIDPFGITLIKHSIEEDDQILRILGRPAAILSSHDILAGRNSGCFFTGTRHLVQTFREYIEASSQHQSEQFSQRMLKIMNMLPAFKPVVLKATMHLACLRNQLAKAGLRFHGDDLFMFVHMADQEVANGIARSLASQGFYVNVQNTCRDLYGISFAINGHHTGEDVINFCKALFVQLKQRGIVDTEYNFDEMPEISIAFLDQTSNELRSIISYKDVIRAENKYRKVFSEDAKKIFPGSDELLSETMAPIKKNDNSFASKDFMDNTYLSEDYCLANTEPYDNSDVVDNIMWSPNVQGLNERPYSSKDHTPGGKENRGLLTLKKSVDSSNINRKEYRNGHGPCDLKYLENLYCTPMLHDSIYLENGYLYTIQL